MPSPRFTAQGRLAIGIVGEAGQQASDASHGNADAERQREQISGAALDPAQFLGNLDAQPSAEQAADNGLATG